jgi:hypothetical protein
MAKPMNTRELIRRQDGKGLRVAMFNDLRHGLGHVSCNACWLVAATPLLVLRPVDNFTNSLKLRED